MVDDDELRSAIDESVRIHRRDERRRAVTIKLLQLLVVALVLGSWELAAELDWLPQWRLFYSRPSDVAGFIRANFSPLMEATAATLQAAFFGLVLGVAVGIVSGLVLGQFRTLDRVVDPLMTVLAGLPRIALAPLFLLWFGITPQAKVFLAFSIVVFVMMFNTRAAVRTVDTEYTTVATLLGAGRVSLFRKVIVPALLPTLLGSLRLAMVFAILGTVASEMVAARKGLGISIVTYTQNLRPEGAFAVLGILACVMTAANSLVRFLERRLLRWQDPV